uniref:Mediator of RNA polymerase II transcription subunit 23 n=1 Tax=Glossina morsitans morsitans TaxID=37546 RepID=A0A1B0G600_GLOMM
MHIILALYDKLSKLELRKRRDQLMWILLPFISGSIQKNSVSNFLPMFKLFDLLHPEQEPLKLPDCNNTSSLRQPFQQMAPICIWIHLMKKVRAENMNISRPLPTALKNHHEYAFLLYFYTCNYITLQFITFHIFLSFLQHLVMSNTIMSMNLGNDFRNI